MAHVVRARMRGGSQAGFTYLGLLIFIAILGAVLGATGEVWRTVQQREKERELLFIGNQFRKAIGLYYARSPGQTKKFPDTLEVLLKDDRYPTIQRYLRKIYRDPITGKTEWGLVKAPGGGVSGVYSLSDERPLQTANFDAANNGLGGATKYSDWQFVYVPPPVRAPAMPPRGVATQGAAPPSRR